MKIIRYFFVGAIAAIVDISIFTLFANFIHFPWFYVSLVSFILATCVNYFLSIRHVFESGTRFDKKREVLLVFFVSFIGLILNQVLLWILIEKYQAHIVIAKFIATASIFFWNYLLRRYVIFNQ